MILLLCVIKAILQIDCMIIMTDSILRILKSFLFSVQWLRNLKNFEVPVSKLFYMIY